MTRSPGPLQPDDAQRTDLDRRDGAVGSQPRSLGSLRALGHRFRRFAQHGGDDGLQLIGSRRDVFRHALAVAQNHEIVGNLQQLLEEMTDIDDADAGIAQAADDLVQTFHLGDMQRRRRLVENENARILQQRARDLDQLPVRQASADKAAY